VPGLSPQWFQYPGLVEPIFTGGETIFEDKWHQAWSQPVRQRRHPTAAVALAASGLFDCPHPLVSFSWFHALAEPIVKQRPALRHAAQIFATISPQPAVSFSWFGHLAEPQRPLKLGLRAKLQQTLAHPPRLLPTPTITGVLDAVERKDTALFGAMRFARAATVEIGLAERIDRPLLGALEIPPPSVIVGTIESPLSPSPGTAVPTAAAVLLTIREL